MVRKYLFIGLFFLMAGTLAAILLSQNTVLSGYPVASAQGKTLNPQGFHLVGSVHPVSGRAAVNADGFINSGRIIRITPQRDSVADWLDYP
jgi:hypothetical protein